MRQTRRYLLSLVFLLLASVALAQEPRLVLDSVVPFQASFAVIPDANGRYTAVGEASLFGLFETDRVQIYRDGSLHVALFEPGRSLILTIYPDDRALVVVEKATVGPRRVRFMAGLDEAAEVTDLGDSAMFIDVQCRLAVIPPRRRLPPRR